MKQIKRRIDAMELEPGTIIYSEKSSDYNYHKIGEWSELQGYYEAVCLESDEDLTETEETSRLMPEDLIGDYIL